VVALACHKAIEQLRSRRPGVPFGDDEGELIGTALGDHKALLLALDIESVVRVDGRT
jgi:hypothetical protein